jgi:hypothetical protein
MVTIMTFRLALVSFACLLLVEPIQCGHIGNSSNSTATAAPPDGEFYTAADSASWAITSTTLSQLLGSGKQGLYDSYIAACNGAILKEERRKQLVRTQEVDEKALERFSDMCTQNEKFRMRMNTYQPSSVYNFTTKGYTKIRTPPGLFSIIQEFWNKNKDLAEIESKETNVYHNNWETPPSMIHLNQPHTGGSLELQAKIWSEAQPLLEEWTGMYLSPVSLYGIRIYHNGSILAPHVDRMPLVTSAISTWPHNFLI